MVSSTTYQCSVALENIRTELGESAVWDARSQTLYFIDIKKHTVHLITPDDPKTHHSIEFGEEVGTVAPIAGKDSILVGLTRDIVEVDRHTGKRLKTLASVSDADCYEPPAMRFNDGKASPAGVFVAGYMHAKWRDGKPGRLYSMQRSSNGIAMEFELQQVLGPDEVVLPNGMAWDMSKHVMYFADSGRGTLTAYTCDESGVPTRDAQGQLQARQVVHIPADEGVPDGITIDADGNVWVALGEKGAVACYHPETGNKVHHVPLLVQRPTACTFGGTHLDTLFVTTRVETGPSASEHWGKLLAVRIPGVRGKDAAYEVQC